MLIAAGSRLLRDCQVSKRMSSCPQSWAPAHQQLTDLYHAASFRRTSLVLSCTILPPPSCMCATCLCAAVPLPASSPFELQSSPDVTPQKPSFQPPGLEGPSAGPTTMLQGSPVGGQADPVLLRPPRHGSTDFALDELARVVRASSNSGIWSMAPGPVCPALACTLWKAEQERL